MEYAHTKRRCNLACTKTACQRSKETRKEVQPKHITNVFVRKKLVTKHADIHDESQEKTRMKKRICWTN